MWLGLSVFAVVLGPAYWMWGGFAGLYGATFAGLLVYTVQNSFADRAVLQGLINEAVKDGTAGTRRVAFPERWGWMLGLSGYGPVFYTACFFTVSYLLPDLKSAWESVAADFIHWGATMVPNAKSFASTVAGLGYPERAKIVEHLTGVGFFIGLMFGVCGIMSAIILAPYVRYPRDKAPGARALIVGMLMVVGGVWMSFFGMSLSTSSGMYRITLHKSWFSMYYIQLANMLIYIGLAVAIFSLVEMLSSHRRLGND